MKKASIILATLLLTSCSITTSSSRDDDAALQGIIKSDNYSAEIISYADKIQESDYININTDSLKLNYIDVTPSKEIYGLINCITGEVEFVNNR